MVAVSSPSRSPSRDKSNNINSSRCARALKIPFVGGLLLLISLFALQLDAPILSGLGEQDISTNRQASVLQDRSLQGKSQQSQGALVQYTKPERGTFEANRLTLRDFTVNGVNLAQYGFETDAHPTQSLVRLDQPYELYEEFNISERLQDKSTEDWKTLTHHHRDLTSTALAFYIDKVAQKRFMTKMGYPTPQSFVLKCRHELLPDTSNEDSLREDEQEQLKVQNLLPQKQSYVAKNAHASCSSGVWLVRYDSETQEQTMGYGGSETIQTINTTSIASSLTSKLHKINPGGWWPNFNATPGLVVEERYSAPDTDQKAAYEFKTFTIWGRVYMAYLKRGNGSKLGVVLHDGSFVKGRDTKVDWDRVPDWMQFDKVVALAEHMGRHKDMCRVDVFVGLPSGSPQLGQPNAKLDVVVSETEFYPTSKFDDDRLTAEAARLWVAGYKMLQPKLIENKEIPLAFREKGYLSEEDLQRYEIPPGGPWNSHGADMAAK